MIDWMLPVKQLDRPDVEGGSHHGPAMHLQAMLDEQGNYVPLSAARIDRDTQRHFAGTFGDGVRFMLTAERVQSKPVYYRADGSPWLPHHPGLTNTAGKPVALSDRAEKAVIEAREADERRAVERAERIANGERVRRQMEDAKVAAAAAQDAVEAHPLWGQF